MDNALRPRGGFRSSSVEEGIAELLRQRLLLMGGAAWVVLVHRSDSGFGNRRFMNEPGH